MQPSNQSLLIEHLLHRTWRRRLKHFVAGSSESLLVIGLCVVILLVVDGFMIRNFNNYLHNLHGEVDFLVRSIGPLLFGLSSLMVWAFHMLIARSYPPRGIMMLPFKPFDWQQAMERLVYLCTMIIFGLLLGPYLVVLLFRVSLSPIAIFDFGCQVVLLIVIGALVGALCAKLNLALSEKFYRFPSITQLTRYGLFVIFQLLSVIVYVEFVLLASPLRPLTPWVPGTVVWWMYRELSANHLMAGLAYPLLSLMLLQGIRLLHGWVNIRLAPVAWPEAFSLPAKALRKIPLNATAYAATIKAFTVAAFRDGETWFMTIATLLIPCTLGLLLRLSHHPEFNSTYVQIVWLILPLVAANFALTARNCLGQSRLAIYIKPITPTVVALSQAVVISMLAFGLGVGGLLLCARLAGLSFGMTELRQFSFLTIGAALMAYVIGGFMKETNRALTMLSAGTIYFLLLLPYIAFNQWLSSKTLHLQLSSSVLVMWILLFAALYGERQQVSE